MLFQVRRKLVAKRKQLRHDSSDIEKKLDMNVWPQKEAQKGKTYILRILFNSYKKFV